MPEQYFYAPAARERTETAWLKIVQKSEARADAQHREAQFWFRVALACGCAALWGWLVR